MRIGLFTDAYLPDINGVVSSVATLKRSLEDIGHTVFVISNHKGMKVYMDEENHILRLPGIEIKKFYGYKMSSPLQFSAEDEVRKMKLDVIHIQTEMGVGTFGRQMAKLLRLPIVYTYHTMYEDYTHYVNPFDMDSVDRFEKMFVRAFSRKLANSSQAVIAPSDKTKKTLISYGVIAPIYIVPTGLDLSEFDRKNLDQERIANIRSSLGLKEDDHVVVYVGRIAAEKSIDIPIEAVSKSNDPKLHLVIVGDGTGLDSYKRLAEQLNISDRVHFTGRINKSEIAYYYYAAFDCFVSASMSETQGMTYIEALASGLVVFGRRDVVLKDLISEGITGYYFDDSDELVIKWDQYFSLDADQRIELRDKCIEKTLPYTDKMFAKKVESVYYQAIDDYRCAYRVEKINVEEDFMRLTLKRDMDDESIRILMPSDDFFELKIMQGTVLDAYLVDHYKEAQMFYKAFGLMKKRALMHDCTHHQMIEYGMQKLSLDRNSATEISNLLVEQHLIDDKSYAFDKASAWHTYGQSKRQIKMKLKKAGIDENYIDDAINDLDDEVEMNNAIKYAKRLMNSLKEQSVNMQRKALVQKLIAKGYSIEIANRATENIEFDGNDEIALQNAYNKAMRLYSAYEPNKRRQKIKSYCIRKGFDISDIDALLEGEDR